MAFRFEELAPVATRDNYLNPEIQNAQEQASFYSALLFRLYLASVETLMSFLLTFLGKAYEYNSPTEENCSQGKVITAIYFL